MRNAFKGVKIVFEGKIINNSEVNKFFDVDGYRQFMLPEQETSVSKIERLLKPYIMRDLKFEHEYTTVHGNIHTMYISSPTGHISMSTRDMLAIMLIEGLLSSVVYGSMKVNATFHPSKNQ